MKVLFVVKNLRVANGVASFIMNYYRQLINNNNVTFDFLIVSDVGSPYYKEIENNGGKIYIMPPFKKILKIKKFLKNLFENNTYDIVHSNVFNSGFIVAYYAKKNNVPVRILHSHATTNGDTTLKRIRNIPFLLLNKMYSNYYFACSELAGKKIFKDRKFYVLNNAINLTKYRYNVNYRNTIRKSNHISDNTIIVGVVGRITKLKNPFFIVKIAEELKKLKIKYELWWLGSGDMDKIIHSTVNEKKLNEYIKFWGSVNDAYKYYSAMDCFILPSLSEAFPVVGIEAQASGLLCFFSNNITRELSLANNTEFLPIDDENVWANKIKNCKLIDREKNISNDFLQFYSIDNLSTNLYLKYKELIEKERKT